ncbi:MAG: glycosyltransferase family 2 protein [Desulfatirhabdiaceae bacterium]
MNHPVSSNPEIDNILHGLSVVVIAKNEADRIPGLIESVGFADEVVVVDSGSDDGTQAICGRLGARVVFHEWAGYAAQKQFATSLARYGWILNLDADEWLSDSLAVEIQQAIRDAPDSVNGFSMPRLSRYLGRWIRHGGWYPDRKVRLVRNGAGQWVGSGLHETLEVTGQVARLNAPILHDVYRNISDQIQTIDRFSGVYAEHKTASGWYVVAGCVHAFGKFLECFVYKLGFLDGLPGLIIAMNSAWYVFLKHAKVWERTNWGRQRTEDDTP